MAVVKCRRKSDWYDLRLPTCPVCKGTGHDPSPRTWFDAQGVERECTCPGCGGFGNAATCTTCKRPSRLCGCPPRADRRLRR